MTALVVTAKAFAARPSELMNIRDPMLALAFDLAAAGELARINRESNGESENEHHIWL